MRAFPGPSRRLSADTAVVSLTNLQRAVWHLGMPVLDARAVAKYKKRAKIGMLWCAVRWVLLGLAALVAFECLGRQWGHAAIVSAAAMVLATLFAWLVSASELHWRTAGYSDYRTSHAVPPHVSAAVDKLISWGVSPARIGVEYLKSDPILFVEDVEQSPGVTRYDLIIW